MVNLGFLNHEHWMHIIDYSDTISPNGMTFPRNSGWYNIIKVTQNSLRRYYQFDPRVQLGDAKSQLFTNPKQVGGSGGFLAFASQVVFDCHKTRRNGLEIWVKKSLPVCVRLDFSSKVVKGMVRSYGGGTVCR